MVVVWWRPRRCPGEGQAVTEVCLHCMATPLAGHALPQHTVCPPLRFYLREMVMVNKQALRLASLSKGCQGAGPSSRRGTTTLTPKETGVCVRERHCLDSVCCHCSLPLINVAPRGSAAAHGALCVVDSYLLPFPPIPSPFLPSPPIPFPPSHPLPCLSAQLK